MDIGKKICNTFYKTEMSNPKALKKSNNLSMKNKLDIVLREYNGKTKNFPKKIKILQNLQKLKTIKARLISVSQMKRGKCCHEKSLLHYNPMQDVQLCFDMS